MEEQQKALEELQANSEYQAIRKEIIVLEDILKSEELEEEIEEEAQEQLDTLYDKLEALENAYNYN